MSFRKLVAVAACVCLFGSTLSLPAHAVLIRTDQLQHRDQEVRSRIDTWLARADVRQALAQRGVAAEQVQARVDALSDDEARQLAARIDQLPAGGDVGTVLGFVFAVFVILLITDILGLTKVFPFTRPIRR